MDQGFTIKHNFKYYQPGLQLGKILLSEAIKKTGLDRTTLRPFCQIDNGRLFIPLESLAKFIVKYRHGSLSHNTGKKWTKNEEKELVKLQSIRETSLSVNRSYDAVKVKRSKRKNNMRGYRVDITFYSPLVFYDPPILDGLVLYAIAKEMNEHRCSYFTPWQQKRGIDGVKELKRFIKYEDKIFLSTQMQYDKESSCEFLDSWKKRFDAKNSKLAGFGKAKRRIDIASGPYRNHNMPLPAKAINKAWWYFIGDGEAVERFLRENIVAIGKKRSEGFGWIKHLEILPEDIKSIKILKLRPIPEDVAGENKIGGQKRIMAWQPPYWEKRNQAICIVPK